MYWYPLIVQYSIDPNGQPAILSTTNVHACQRVPKDCALNKPQKTIVLIGVNVSWRMSLQFQTQRNQISNKRINITTFNPS